MLGAAVAGIGLAVFFCILWMRSKWEEHDLLRKYRPGHRRTTPVKKKAD
jgi:hypothetical protein